MINISIHHSARPQSIDKDYYKSSVFSLDEYIESMQRKRKINEYIMSIIFIIVIIFRAYIFLKFGQ